MPIILKLVELGLGKNMFPWFEIRILIKTESSATLNTNIGSKSYLPFIHDYGQGLHLSFVCPANIGYWGSWVMVTIRLGLVTIMSQPINLIYLI